MESINTRFYGKRDDFNFPIVNFRFICSNILAAPAYGVYISQLIRYSRTCGSYKDFLDGGLQLTRNPLNQGFNLVEVITLKVRVTWSLVLCVCFVDRCLSFCPISFGHCVVCLSSVYEFWLRLWYLQIFREEGHWCLVSSWATKNERISTKGYANMRCCIDDLHHQFFPKVKSKTRIEKEMYCRVLLVILSDNNIKINGQIFAFARSQKQLKTI